MPGKELKTFANSRKLGRILRGCQSDPREWAVNPLWMFLALGAGYWLSKHARRVKKGTQEGGRTFSIAMRIL